MRSVLSIRKTWQQQQHSYFGYFVRMVHGHPFSFFSMCFQLGMDQYLLIPFLGAWTSIYQLFWCSPGVQGFDTLPCKKNRVVLESCIETCGSWCPKSSDSNSSSPPKGKVQFGSASGRPFNFLNFFFPSKNLGMFSTIEKNAIKYMGSQSSCLMNLSGYVAPRTIENRQRRCVEVSSSGTRWRCKYPPANISKLYRLGSSASLISQYVHIWFHRWLSLFSSDG